MLTEYFLQGFHQLNDTGFAKQGIMPFYLTELVDASSA